MINNHLLIIKCARRLQAQDSIRCRHLVLCFHEPFVCLGAYVVHAVPVIGVRAMVDHESADLIVFAIATRARTPGLIQVDAIPFHNIIKIEVLGASPSQPSPLTEDLN